MRKRLGVTHGFSLIWADDYLSYKEMGMGGSCFNTSQRLARKQGNSLENAQVDNTCRTKAVALTSGTA